MRNLVLFFVAILIPLMAGSQTLPEGINLDYRVYTNYIQIFIGVLDGVADSLQVVEVENEPHYVATQFRLKSGGNKLVIFPSNSGEKARLYRFEFFKEGKMIGWKEMELKSGDGFAPVFISPDNGCLLSGKDIIWLKSKNPYSRFCYYKVVFRDGVAGELDSFTVAGAKDTMRLENKIFSHILVEDETYEVKIFTSTGAPFGWSPEMDTNWNRFIFKSAASGEPLPEKSFELHQNYPNPFNPETRISYSLAKAGHVKLAVYNVLGQKVADLVDEYKAANSYKVTLDASNLTSGIYLYRLEVGDFSKTMKMMLQR